MQMANRVPAADKVEALRALVCLFPSEGDHIACRGLSYDLYCLAYGARCVVTITFRVCADVTSDTTTARYSCSTGTKRIKPWPGLTIDHRKNPQLLIAYPCSGASCEH